MSQARNFKFELLAKTKLCFSYPPISKVDHCDYGEHCTYAHGPGELRRLTPQQALFAQKGTSYAEQFGAYLSNGYYRDRSGHNREHKVSIKDLWTAFYDWIRTDPAGSITSKFRESADETIATARKVQSLHAFEAPTALGDSASIALFTGQTFSKSPTRRFTAEQRTAVSEDATGRSSTHTSTASTLEISFSGSPVADSGRQSCLTATPVGALPSPRAATLSPSPDCTRRRATSRLSEGSGSAADPWLSPKHLRESVDFTHSFVHRAPPGLTTKPMASMPTFEPDTVGNVHYIAGGVLDPEMAAPAAPTATAEEEHSLLPAQLLEAAFSPCSDKSRNVTPVRQAHALLSSPMWQPSADELFQGEQEAKFDRAVGSPCRTSTPLGASPHLPWNYELESFAVDPSCQTSVSEAAAKSPASVESVGTELGCLPEPPKIIRTSDSSDFLRSLSVEDGTSCGAEEQPSNPAGTTTTSATTAATRSDSQTSSADRESAWKTVGSNGRTKQKQQPAVRPQRFRSAFKLTETQKRRARRKRAAAREAAALQAQAASNRSSDSPSADFRGMFQPRARASRRSFVR